MFTLAKYNLGAYRLTPFLFRDMDSAVKFLEIEKLPVPQYIIVDLTFVQEQRKAA
jgi:hypothetical protein